MGLFSTTVSAIRKGLARTREAVGSGFRSLLMGRALDDELISEIEQRLIAADVGVAATTSIIKNLRQAYKDKEIVRGEDTLEFLKQQLIGRWEETDRSLAVAQTKPTVILVAGINGSGKTTSVAKITKSLKEQGRTVLLAAADTYRAAATEQLEIWSNRLDVQIVKGEAGSDPAAVVFDACDAAIARHVDALVIDTAGRLHTQDNLMRQLTKIRDVVAKKIPGAPHEVLLVLDATAGQNAITQAKVFAKAINVTGIFLAKLDGTAKGGIVVAIQDVLGIPVKLIGVGETLDDVEAFDPTSFMQAMFEA
ncbi:MAG: signal recognition particle-docking protein FtsY [Planctomycetes bacterium]|nr:signal recognition particle-docking protein FtsY [Planctomycetota bacterium]